MAAGGMAHDIEGVVALLHVSALVGALMLAYIKIDKLYEGPDAFQAGLSEIRDIAREIVLRNGLNGLPVHRRDFGQIQIIFPACVICLIADQPREIGRLMSALHCCYRQIHIPFFLYFRHRWHILVGMCMAAVSLAMFFGLAFVLIWKFDLDPRYVKGGFVALAAFTLWLLLTNAIASRLQPPRLRRKCETLMTKIVQRIKDREDRAWKALEDYEKYKPPAGNGTGQSSAQSNLPGWLKRDQSGR
jgi:hypothetical protein